MSDPYKYSWQWSSSIVDSFVEKYVRGTRNLARIVDVSYTDVRKALTIWLARGNSIRFEALKRTIKYLESCDWDDFKRLDKEDRKLLYSRYLWIAEDEVLDALSVLSDLDNTKN